MNSQASQTKMLKKPLMMLVALSTLLVSGCDILNTVRMRQINSDVEPNWVGQQRIKLKSAFIGEKPYIYATVDGEELLFLLDTGASFLILSDSPKVQKLALKRGFDLSMGGWGEQERSQAYQTDIGSIDLGGVRFDGMKAGFIPVGKTHYYLRPDEVIKDGVIGHDIMRHFTWEIDAANNAIYISQGPYQPEPGAQYLALSEFFSKISIEASLAINDEHIATGDFIIDTGSRHYVKFSDSYAERNDQQITAKQITAADFGLSGKVEHQRATLPYIQLGDIKLEKVKVNLIPNDDDDDLWILGNALMNQFKTVIDYKNEAFYLIPQQDYFTDYNLFGLELRKIQSGEFVVRYLFPDLTASELDIKVGDLVTSIDDTNARNITLMQYNDIATTVGKHKVCIERDNLCFDLEARHIKGYSDL